MASTAIRTNFGSCKVYYGDPTAGGGAMVDCGVMENVTCTVDQGTTWTSNANIAGVADHNSVRGMPTMATVDAEMADWSKVILAALNVNGTNTGSGETQTIGFGDRFRTITAGTLFVLPEDDTASGVTSDYGFWIPSASVAIGRFIGYARPARNAETSATWAVKFTANYREFDQTSPTPVSIPVDNRICFYGDPTGLSLTWSIA